MKKKVYIFNRVMYVPLVQSRDFILEQKSVLDRLNNKELYRQKQT